MKEILNREFEFIREQEPKSWDEKLAMAHYLSLYKEYCLCDLSRYMEHKVALRWRTKREVVQEKGTIICANIKCRNKSSSSWEMPFRYEEKGESKTALVKVRVCEECERKLEICK